MVRQGQLGAFSSCMGFPTSLVGRLPIDKALMKEGDRFQGKSFGRGGGAILLLFLLWWVGLKGIKGGGVIFLLAISGG